MNTFLAPGYYNGHCVCTNLSKPKHGVQENQTLWSCSIQLQPFYQAILSGKHERNSKSLGNKDFTIKIFSEH